MDTSSPARLYCTLIGAVLVLAGILGFFYEASFSTGDDVEADEVLGILAVNGWHNLVHIGLGAVLLAGAGSAARETALGVGLLYLVIAIWGFLAVDDGFGDILGLVPVNTEDNWLHVILGLLGLGAGAATPAVPRAAGP
ncbi:MAG: DUF4383 domain-containing protein [Solirubrobacterales bacterium]